MRPQDFCSIPWCGKGFGEPYKVKIVDGERLRYPAMIDGHHSEGQKRGEVVYICHECHMMHHDGRIRLHFKDIDGVMHVNGQPLAIGEDV